MTNGTDVRTPAPPGTGVDTVPLSRYANFLRRNKAAVVVLLILGTALSVLRVVAAHPTYTSTVEVFAPAVPLHTGLGLTAGTTTVVSDRAPRQTTMDTEAQLAQADQVLSAVAKVRGFRISRERLKKRISITVPAYTQVLSIRVTAYSAGEAQAGARTLVRSYLALRKNIVAGIQARNLRVLENSLTLLRAQLRALHGKSSDPARLTPYGRREELSTRIIAVRDQVAQARDKTPQFGEIVLGPTTPQHPNGSRADVALSTGCGIGLLGGLLLGLVQDRRPRRIRSFADVRRAVSLPVIAEVDSSPDGLHEAGRKLRNVIHTEEAEVVLLTGVSGSATEQLARALTSVITQAGMSTAILRVGAGAERGRRAGTPLSTATDVHTVPTGGDGQLSAAVRRARRDTDLVVVIGPALHSPDAVILATICDLTFVVVALSRISVEELASGASYLGYAATPARGLVLTRPHGGGGRRRSRGRS
jgi:capsular polysaccharide biosynthesis protein